jgi:hypothetical protein
MHTLYKFFDKLQSICLLGIVAPMVLLMGPAILLEELIGTSFLEDGDTYFKIIGIAFVAPMILKLPFSPWSKSGGTTDGRFDSDGGGE